MYNTRFKFCDGELVEIMRTNRNIWGQEKRNVEKSNKVSEAIEKFHEEIWNSDTPESVEMFKNLTRDFEQKKKESLKRSQRRAKQAVFDLCACNKELDLFITLTLDKEKVNRTDYSEVVKKLNRWLDNKVRRNGLKYVIVAELHKKGGIHFHGLINSSAVELVDSNHKDKKGNTIYNLPQWSYGFTTAIKLYGQRSSTCGYITKYITKSGSKVGGRWYYSGGKLQKPTYMYDVTDSEFVRPDDNFSSYLFTVDNANLTFEIYKKKSF